MALSSVERRRQYVAKKLALLNTYLLPCECGCGELIQPYNSAFERRHFAWGHSPAHREAKQKFIYSNLGKHFTLEHNAKISQANKGKKKSVEAIEKRRQSVERNGSFKGSNNPFYGRHHSDNTKAKFSAKGQTRIGDKNANWRGGTSFIPYTPEFTNRFRKLIRDRDGNRCQRCGKTRRQEGKELSAHHIDHDKTNNDPTNLITVCNSCNIYLSAHRDESLIIFPKRKMLLS